MSTYTTTKFALTAANGDDPILNGDNQMRGLADTTEAALANVVGHYKELRAADALLQAATISSTGVRVLGDLTATNVGYIQIASSATGYAAAFYLDPADYTVGTRTTKYRLRVAYSTNGTQSGQTTTFGLYPVSSISGGIVTLGAVTAGSTVAFANPAINTLGQGNSGDFTAPTAGYYALGFAAGAAWTAAAEAAVSVRLQMRQV